jgi:hypothetical protein
MESKDQRLLRSGKPKDDESLMSYIIRLTEQNGYPSPSWIVKRAELHYGMNRSCSFVYRSPETLKTLSGLTGTDISELASLTYSPESKRNYDGCLFYGSAIHQSYIRLGYPKICPKCLSESLHCRRIWELSAVTTCLKHRCLLIDECPNCMRRISYARNRVGICSCDFDWREATVMPVEDSEIALTRHLHYLCGLLNNKFSAKGQLEESPITDLGLQDFLSVLFFFAGIFQNVLVSNGLHLVIGMKNTDIHALFASAYSVFEDWPNNFYRFLRWRRAQEKDYPFIHYRLKSALYMDFGSAYIGIYKILSGSQFDFIKAAFINYLVGEWEGCNIPPTNRTKGSGCYRKSKYVSKADAIRLLGTDDKGIDQLIEDGGLKTIVRSKGMKRLIFVDVADIARLLREASIRNLDRQ